MKTPRLARGIIRELRNFGKISVSEIVESIGWERTQIKNEIRRLKDSTILGVWITETKTPKDQYYELDVTIRNGATVDCMYEMAKKSFKFNSPIEERL